MMPIKKVDDSWVLCIYQPNVIESLHRDCSFVANDDNGKLLIKKAQQLLKVKISELESKCLYLILFYFFLHIGFYIH